MVYYSRRDYKAYDSVSLGSRVERFRREGREGRVSPLELPGTFEALSGG